MKNIKRFIMNALALCGVSLIMRTVGVVFGAYVSGKAGAEAMGLYSLLSGVYGFAVTFATSGIGLATTRLVSEALGTGDRGRARATLHRAILYSLAFSTAANLLLFSFAEPIGCFLLGDARTVLPLRILSFSLVPISLTSVMNGYFTALRKVYKNAVIQLLEQGVRILAVSRLLTLLLPHGIAYACAALAIGGMLSECGSFLFSLLALLWENRKHFRKSQTPSGGIMRGLCAVALPVAFSAYARAGLLSLEHMLIPPCLRKSGKSQAEALASYGTLYSMVMPIVLFPSAFIGAFSGLLVPELAECAVKNNQRQIRYITERVMQLSLLFSIAVSGIMICFSRELGDLIYPGKQTHIYLRMVAPLIPVMYLDASVDAMLKGLGEQVYSMGINIADSLLSIVLVVILLPRFGTEGYILTIYIAELFNAALSISRLMQKSGLRPHLARWVFLPLVCVIGAASISNILSHFIHFSAFSEAFRTIFHIVLTAALYLIFLITSHSFDKEDIRWALGILRRTA